MRKAKQNSKSTRLYEALGKVKQTEKPDQGLPEANDEEGEMMIRNGRGPDLYSSVYMLVTCQPWNAAVKTSLSGSYTSRKLLFSKTRPGLKKVFSHP